MLCLRSSNIHHYVSCYTQPKTPKECDCSIRSLSALQCISYYHDRSFPQILHEYHRYSFASTTKGSHAIHFPSLFYTRQASLSLLYFCLLYTSDAADERSS